MKRMLLMVGDQPLPPCDPSKPGISCTRRLVLGGYLWDEPERDIGATRYGMWRNNMWLAYVSGNDRCQWAGLLAGEHQKRQALQWLSTRSGD
jgi:hypothetical protein